MSQIIAKAMEPMRQVTEAFNHSGIFDAMAIVGKAVKQHAEYMKDWSDALTFPAITTTETIIFRRIERSPNVAVLCDEDKSEIVEMLIGRLKQEILTGTGAAEAPVILAIEGGTIYRIAEGQRLNYKLSENRRKLLCALTHRPQPREVLIIQSGTADKDTLRKLVTSLNKQLGCRLHLREPVILGERNYYIDEVYSIRRV